MRILTAWAATACLVSLPAVAAPATASPDTRPRLIVLTDIGNEPDDAESMVRLLTYSNDFAIEGLVATTSRHLPKGVHRELIEQRVDAYGAVADNLRKHDPRYPEVRSAAGQAAVAA